MITYCSYFPRSGGNYLVRNYSEHILKPVIHTHSPEFLSMSSAFSVIRKPSDALSSMALISLSKTMVMRPEDLGDDDRKILFLKRSIEQYAKEYSSFYTNPAIKKVPVCNFDNLINDVVALCWRLSSTLGHKGRDFVVTEAVSRSDYFASARVPELADLVEAATKEVDLSPEFKIYNEILQTAI